MVLESAIQLAAIRKFETDIETAISRNGIKPRLLPVVLEPLLAFDDGAFVRLPFDQTTATSHHVHHHDSTVVEIGVGNPKILRDLLAGLEDPERKILSRQHVDLGLVLLANILLQNGDAFLLAGLQRAEVVILSPLQRLRAQVNAHRGPFRPRFHPVAADRECPAKVFAQGLRFAFKGFAVSLLEKLDLVVGMLNGLLIKLKLCN